MKKFLKIVEVFLHFFMKKPILLLSILFLFLFITQAQVLPNFSQWSQILINKEDVGTLPTSPFYFLKEWQRGIRKFFTFDPVKKAELELRYTDEKLLETVKVTQEKCTPESCDQKALAKALNNYLEAKRRLIERLKTLDEKNPNVEKLVEKTFQRVIQHEALFDELKTKAGGITLPHIADSTAKQFRNEIVDVTIKTKSSPRLIRPDLPYSDEIRDLKTLEILMRIVDELPEEKKETKKLIEDTLSEVFEKGEMATSTIKEIMGKIEVKSEADVVIDKVPFKKEALTKVLNKLIEPLPAEEKKIHQQKLQELKEEKPKPILIPPNKREPISIIDKDKKPFVAEGCYIGGCAGEICSDEPGVMSPCLWKPEFACYKLARCERQADGKCGWTMTPELKRCLESTLTQPIEQVP